MSLGSSIKKATTRKKTRKSPPVTTATGPAGAVVLTKPKRSDSLVDLPAPASRPKAPVNPPSDRAFLENAYKRYYANGVRTPMANRRKRVYSFHKTRTPGIAWAEEPKYFLNKQAGSFTSNRRDIIADVIATNDKVDNVEDFIDLVNAAFTAKGVNPAAPHTHLAKTP